VLLRDVGDNLGDRSPIGFEPRAGRFRSVLPVPLRVPEIEVPSVTPHASLGPGVPIVLVAAFSISV
jgi:hypothetical protein